jgi:hypothetical protein
LSDDSICTGVVTHTWGFAPPPRTLFRHAEHTLCRRAVLFGRVGASVSGRDGSLSGVFLLPVTVATSQELPVHRVSVTEMQR